MTLRNHATEALERTSKSNVREPPGSLLRLSKLIGMTAHSVHGEDLGEIADVAMNAADGTPAFVLVRLRQSPSVPLYVPWSQAHLGDAVATLKVRAATLEKYRPVRFIEP